MTTKSFHDLVLESNKIPWNRNWHSDVQSGNFSASEYSEIAKKLRIEALRSVKNFLERVPSAVIKDDHPTNPRFYTLKPRDYHGAKTTSIDDLIAEIEANNRAFAQKKQHDQALSEAISAADSGSVLCLLKKAKHYEEVTEDTRFLKGEERLAKKLKEYFRQGKDHPEEIRDYLRLQILFDNAEDIAAGRHELQYGTTLSITSQKDKLRRPDENGGHRSFMAHALVSDSEHSLKFEIMLSLYEAETFSVDKTFRNSERTSFEMGTKYAANQAPSLSSAFFSAAGVLEQLRKISFYNLYAETEGMNDLLDPDIDVNGICQQATHLAEFNATSCAYILGKLPTVTRLFPSLTQGERHLH